VQDAANAEAHARLAGGGHFEMEITGPALQRFLEQTLHAIGNRDIPGYLRGTRPRLTQLIHPVVLRDLIEKRREPGARHIPVPRPPQLEEHLLCAVLRLSPVAAKAEEETLDTPPVTGEEPGERRDFTRARPEHQCDVLFLTEGNAPRLMFHGGSNVREMKKFARERRLTRCATVP
jgi:hypothetical protein